MVDGVKTGYLAVEKYSLASSMKKMKEDNWGISGFENKNLRSSVIKIIKLGFRNTNTFEISKKDETIFEIDTWLLRIRSKQRLKRFYVTINKKDIRYLNVSLDYNGPIQAPIDKNTEVAKIIVSQKDNIIKEILYMQRRNQKSKFFRVLLL